MCPSSEVEPNEQKPVGGLYAFVVKREQKVHDPSQP